jgi:uncharacterized membrane protein YdjX (TVP38/TMEM64 family)
MLAGALYGTLLGSVVVFVGASLGAIAVFLLGRSWLREWARRRLAAAGSSPTANECTPSSGRASPW